MSRLKHGVRQASLFNLFKYHSRDNCRPTSISSSFCTCRSFLPSSNVLTERRVSSLVASSQLRSICTSSKLEASWTFKRKTVPVDEEKETQQDEDNVESQEASGPLKSHPYRNICPWKSKSELAKFLLENQIFNDYGILVINKPFGVGVRNQTLQQLQRNGSHNQLHLRGIQTVPYTLEDIVPTLRNLLEKPELVFVKSTEKLTSGLAVFAMDEQTGTKFTKALKTSKSYYDTLYKYHVITILPPMFHKEPGEMERIGVTVKAGVGTDVPQPIIVRGYSNNSVKRDDVKSIHTRVYPLKMGFGGGSLVEINTSQVKHNFLRIYCADKLAPILGDQLYSCRVQTLRGVPTKIDPTHLAPGSSPQKLPKEMLTHLKFNTSEDSIIIPPHVHLRSYKIRKFLPMGGVLELEAPYPPHFKWTCEQLGIQLDVDEPGEQIRYVNKKKDISHHTR